MKKPKDDKLQLLVYVLCYDDASEKQATAAFQPYEWTRIVRLQESKFSKYMEGVAFLEVLPRLYEEWATVDYVGTLSWRAPSKIDVSKIPKVCEFCIKNGEQAVVFLPSQQYFEEQARRNHPRFFEVWNPLMHALGISPRTIPHDMPTFFCNYWCATPKVMLNFIKFFASAVHVLENVMGNARDALWSDSTYGTHLSVDRLMEVYGKPYMPLHPFVGERLACVFFAMSLDAYFIASLAWS